MPIATRDAYLAALVNRSRVLVYRRNQTNPAGVPSSGWVTLTGPSGVAPTTAVAVDSATPGAIRPAGPLLAQIHAVQISNSTSGVTSSGTTFICDRLSHQGGLVANIATPQTTNLPTAALTRYTDGDGVWIGLEIHVLLGAATEVTATVTYTNQDGVGGRLGRCQIGGGSHSSASGFCVVALQAGDTGARSVESVQLSGTTGAAGSFGVVLFKPLIPFPHVGGANGETLFPVGIDYLLGGGCGALPPIDPSACLWTVSLLNGATATSREFELSFIENS